MTHNESDEHPHPPTYKPSAHPTSPRWSPPFKLAVGIILFILVVLLLYKARIVFVPLIIGAILAYLIHPLAHQVSRETKLSHGVATALVFVILLATLIPITLLAAPLLGEQILSLRNQLVAVIADLQDNSSNVITIIPGIEIEVGEIVNEVGSSITTTLMGIAVDAPSILFDASKTLLLTIFTIFIAFYLCADAHKIVSWLKHISPPGYRNDVAMLLGEINDIWSDFFRGTMLVAIVAGILNTIIALAIGLPEPLLMGVLAALLEFLVSVGHTVWLVVALILAVTQGSTWLPVSPLVFALIVLGSNLIFTKLDLNFIIPRIVGERMHLHPMVVILGIIVGATVGGVLGIALAAPMIATLRILSRYIRAKLFDLDPYPEIVAANPPEAKSSPKPLIGIEQKHALDETK